MCYKIESISRIEMKTKINKILTTIIATAMSVALFSSIYAESLNDSLNNTDGMIITDSVTTNNG